MHARKTALGNMNELFSESAKEKGDIEMPAELRVIDEGISRFRDEAFGEIVSNFSLYLLAGVNVDREAGGPGVLIRIRRFPDQVEQLVLKCTHKNSFRPSLSISAYRTQGKCILGQRITVASERVCIVYTYLLCSM